jgi:hypothetical protein
MLGAAVMLAAAGAAPQVKAKPKAARTQAVVAAREFVLVDRDGNQRGAWHITKDEAHFTLYVGGKPRVLLAAMPDGSAGVTVGERPEGTATLYLSNDGRAGLGIENRTGKINVGPNDEGRPSIKVTDPDKAVLFESNK